MQLSGQLQVPAALALSKELPVLTEQKVCWAPKPLRTKTVGPVRTGPRLVGCTTLTLTVT